MLAALNANDIEPVPEGTSGLLNVVDNGVEGG